MMQIIIDGKEYPCKVETSKTQNGQDIVRVISDSAPVAENGFTLRVNDDILNREDYKYLYREEGYVKEYTVEPEEMVNAYGVTTGVPESPIQRQFDSVNRRITEITPYEQSKKAYYGEIEKVFYGVPNGNLSVFYDGEYSVNRIEDRVIIKLPSRLTETKDITIQIQ